MAKSTQGIVSSIKALLPFGDDSQGLGATAMLREEHRMVDALFEEFRATGSSTRRRDIATKVIAALRMHTTLEEELFYPALRRTMRKSDDELIDCAYEEHAIAKRLLDELDRMKPSDSRFSAKFKVLAESVRHHVREEEAEILPRAESSDLDLDALGEKMRERQRELRGGGRTKRGGSRPASRPRRTTSSASKRSKTTSSRATRGASKARTRKTAASAKKRASAKKSTGAKKASGRSARSSAARRSRRAG